MEAKKKRKKEKERIKMMCVCVFKGGNDKGWQYFERRNVLWGFFSGQDRLKYLPGRVIMRTL